MKLDLINDTQNERVLDCLKQIRTFYSVLGTVSEVCSSIVVAKQIILRFKQEYFSLAELKQDNSGESMLFIECICRNFYMYRSNLLSN